jgi:hypothetical protein
MKDSAAVDKSIKVYLIVRDGCSFSDRVVKTLKSISNSNPDIDLSIEDVGNVTLEKLRSGGITPSIWVNGELWFLGAFNELTFQEKIELLAISPNIH